MTGSRFDAWTRRSVSLAAGTLLAGLVPLPGVARKRKNKRKKKCKKPKVKCGKKKCCAPGCRFTKTATLWTLQADCTAAQPIFIPNGVTLDGGNHTISLIGPVHDGVAAFEGNASVRNLTVDGSGMTPCNGSGAHGIYFFGVSGSIENVTVTHMRCGGGIGAVDADASGPQLTVDITNVTVSDISYRDEIVASGIGVGPGGSNLIGTISGSRVVDAPIGIVVYANFTVEDNQLEGNFIGMEVGPASPIVTGNTIVGPGAVSGFPNGFWPTCGVWINDHNVAGSVSDNTISNFFDSRTGDVACGILVDPYAGSVSIGTNSFPNPPGNEQNVCDNRL